MHYRPNDISLCPLSIVYCVSLCVLGRIMDAQETLFRKLNKQFHFLEIAAINYCENTPNTQEQQHFFFANFNFNQTFSKNIANIHSPVMMRTTFSIESIS